MYTNFCFSTAATITARPLGSDATYWPATALRHPDLPNFSPRSFEKCPLLPSKQSTDNWPESEPTAKRSLLEPTGRNAHMLRITPKASSTHTDSKPPAPARSSSRREPWFTTISAACGEA
eukprot:CAMPEP_0171547810 /NCGR_PEP_ID=MMETSP0960-20121227/5445_1 /TAXON_ID=87120 /ORGANISM="Aurantiochytrium limacinum, Strain ATCCMYA-1381" /LENGTH=119 /DNA_ID=CAMNT_0012096135 /DNA_START=574 /DNA_END=933 /DNA_ORIENTATION=-